MVFDIEHCESNPIQKPALDYGLKGNCLGKRGLSGVMVNNSENSISQINGESYSKKPVEFKIHSIKKY